MEKGFVFTVQIIVKSEEIKSQGAACDYVSSLLSESERDTILDWAYVKFNNVYQLPTEIDIPDFYEEGDFFI